jgi:hypothetical protein
VYEENALDTREGSQNLTLFGAKKVRSFVTSTNRHGLIQEAVMVI